MPKKVTMQAIAEQLNISKNSVSQALTGKPGVSEETRNLVRKMADEMGYNYNSLRKQNAWNSTGNIALIASEQAFSLKSFFGEIYLSIEREVMDLGMNLAMQSINQDSMNQHVIPQFIKNRTVDGILILSHMNTEYINTILSYDLPTVIIDHHHPHIKADAILTNNRFGAYKAVEHLIDFGHRNIGFVGDTTLSPSYYERLEGYKMAFRDYKLEINEALLFSEMKEDEDSIRGLLDDLNEAPTAWFCVNDGLGFLISSNLQKRGLTIPEDVSVCSFDNGQLSQISSPKTTTVAIDLELYGKKAVEQLIWRIKNKEEIYQELLLDSKLIKRESTAVAPKKVTGPALKI